MFDFFRDKREFQVSLEPPTSFLDEGTIGRHFPSLVASLPEDELIGLDKIKKISIMEKLQLRRKEKSELTKHFCNMSDLHACKTRKEILYRKMKTGKKGPVQILKNPKERH